MTYDNEAIARHAYHTAEGSVQDVAGFVGSFAEDGVINMGHAGREHSGVGQVSYRGEQLGELVLSIAKLFPDVHRELHRVLECASAEPIDADPGGCSVFMRSSAESPRKARIEITAKVAGIV